MPASPSMTTAAGITPRASATASPSHASSVSRPNGQGSRGHATCGVRDGAGNRKSLRDAGSWRAAFWVERRTLIGISV